MKKLLTYVILALCVSGCATTHNAWTEKSASYNKSAQKRVAIFPFSGDRTGAISDAVATELLAMGYEIAERTSLDSVLKEMRLEYGGVLNKEQTKEVARLINADAIIFGSVIVSYTGRIYALDMRFVEISSGEILWSCNYLNKTGVDTRRSIIEISNSIQEKIGRYISSARPDKYSLAVSRLSLSKNPTQAVKKYKKVALLPLTGTRTYAEDDAAYGALVTSLIGNGVEMVERKELVSILGEQANYASGIYNTISVAGIPKGDESVISTSAFSGRYPLSQKDLSEIGQVTGADGLLVGSFITNWSSPFHFTIANLRLLDLESGKIAWSGSYYNKAVGEEDFVISMDWLAIALAPIITSETNSEYMERYSTAVKNRKAAESPIIEKLFPTERYSPQRGK